ncbi:MAG: glycosyltransferase [Syntrophobacterales bacterium]|nr:glycosyltransferase [Syntrophobacterales bacterium]
MKGDLHVHSRYSTRPSQWILRKLGCPESFTPPEVIYRLAKDRGMEIVTITDHNTLSGVMEIADKPGVIIGEEVTTYFPEDGCKIHVLVYGINEEQHREIQKIRENIYQLVAYLNHEHILHAVAHPLFGVNGKLTIAHFDKLLLLFRIFEINGSRNDLHNQTLKRVIQGIDCNIIYTIAEQHSIIPFPEKCEEKIIIAGSDDHSGLNIARFWTEVPGSTDVNSFLEGIREGRTRVYGIQSTPFTMGLNLFSIAYQYYRERLKIHRRIHDMPLAKFLSRILAPGNEAPRSSWHSRIYYFVRSHWSRRNGSDLDEESNSLKTLFNTSHRLIEDNLYYSSVISDGKVLSMSEAEKIWFRFVSDVFNRLLASFSRRFVENLSRANFFDVFGALGATGALSTIAAPFIAAFSHYAKDQRFAEEVMAEWKVSPKSYAEGTFSVGHFSDTVFEVNGVAKTLMQFRKATQMLGFRWTIITSSEEKVSDDKSFANFPPIGVYELPEYPEIKLAIPPFLDILSYCFNQRFSQLHAATPGPLGLTALLVGRILSIPVVATYHTALPQYVARLTGDEYLESATWRYVLWYYGQMDCIFVPSTATARELTEQGIPEEKIKLFQRGVDTELFHPNKFSMDLRDRYGIHQETVLLYVGRVSKEKGLSVLSRAFRIISEEIPGLVLLIVGDGPYSEELKEELKGTRAIFTGYLSGEDLAQTYASSDIFVFPSATDTFGNVVLEAQASGLPVIVTDQGGPKENIIPGETGLIFKAGDVFDLVRAIKELIRDPTRRLQMGKRARAVMEKRSFLKTFVSTWELYQQVTTQTCEESMGKAG